MSKERLSKLQKWILNRCLENKGGGIARGEIREFFGKKLPPKRHSIEALRESTFEKAHSGQKERNLTGMVDTILLKKNLFLPDPLKRLFQEVLII